MMGKSSRRKKEPAAETDRAGIAVISGSGKGLVHPGRHAFSILLIAAAGLAGYANSFGVPFVFDDVLQIANNPMVKSLSNFVLYLKGQDFGVIPNYVFSPTRVLGYLTFALNYSLGRLDVAGYHAVNLFVHMTNAILVYFLVILTFRTPALKVGGPPSGDSGSLLSDPKLPALFAALLFVSHPVQTQAVTYIVQRFASLATLFYLASLVFFIQGRLRSGTSGKAALFGLSLFSALLAMKTKEIAFTLPFVIVLYEFTFFPFPLKKRLVFILPVLLLLLVIPLTISGTNKTIGEFLSDVTQITRAQSNLPRTDYFFTELTVIVTYIRLLLLPIHQNLDYDYPVFRSFFSPRVMLSAALIAGLLGAAIYLLYGSSGRGNEKIDSPVPAGENHQAVPSRLPFYLCAGFGILWFFITLAVESTVIPISDVIFEHRLYLPSVGAFIALSSGVGLLTLRYSPSKKRALCAVVILALLSATVMRNHLWRNETSLWEDVVQKSPNKERALHLLAGLYLKNQQFEKAGALLEKLSGRTFESPDVHEGYYQNLAELKASQKKFEEAEKALRRALDVNKGSYISYSQLCSLYLQTGKLQNAEGACLNALRLMPRYPPALNYMSVLYRRLGRIPEAISSAQAAIGVDPDYAPPYNNLGLSYVQQKKFSDALKEFRKAIYLEPNFTEAYSNLGAAHLVLGDFASATEELQSAVTLSPTYAAAHFNLAVAYDKTGNRAKAIQEYEIVKDISPEDAESLGSELGLKE